MEPAPAPASPESEPGCGFIIGRFLRGFFLSLLLSLVCILSSQLILGSWSRENLFSTVFAVVGTLVGAVVVGLLFVRPPRTLPRRGTVAAVFFILPFVAVLLTRGQVLHIPDVGRSLADVRENLKVAMGLSLSWTLAVWATSVLSDHGSNPQS